MLSSIPERKLKSTLEKLSCPVHRKHPTISLIRGELSISCCCDRFRKEILSKTEQLIQEEVKSQVKKKLGLK